MNSTEKFDRLFAEHRPWAEMVGRVLAARIPGLRYDDAEADALLGLAQACKRFDHGLGNKFTTYAGPFVKGRVLDGARQAGVIRRRKQGGYAHEPTVESLDAPTEADAGFRRSSDAKYYIADPKSKQPHDLVEGEVRARCRRILRGLQPLEREALYQYAVEGRRLQEIAALEGCEESNISLTIKKAIEFIRETRTREECLN